MYQVGVDFKILKYGEHITVGYKKASGHLIFDIKMDLTRKVQWVKNGHLTPDLEDLKYPGVVSCESVRIALTYVYLRQTQVLAAYIRNAYLQVPTSEKHYIIYGLEFGLENLVNRALIVRALYGDKVDGCDFWNHM